MLAFKWAYVPLRFRRILFLLTPLTHVLELYLAICRYTSGISCSLYALFVCQDRLRLTRLKHAHGHRYQLHALVLSRSPYLAHLIASTPKTGGLHSIYVPLESYPEITDQV